MSPIVETRGLGRRYGTRDAVRGVDLALAPGECVALVGHNGAGKSTLIKMILGLVRPTSGRVRVLGEDPASSGAVGLRRHLGFLPESVVFPRGLSGRETLAFYAHLKHQPVAGNEALLERVGLADAADRRVGTYSKGMRQRLGLAQALIGAPRLLLLDEPTSGLDPASRRSFYAVVRDLAAAGTTVLLSSHALGEIEEWTDRIAVMSRGRLVACGSLDDLRAATEVPVQVRLRLAEGAAPPAALLDRFAAGAQIDGRQVAFRCAATAKMEMLRQAAACPGIADVEVLPASLDALYGWFMEAGTA